MAPNPDVSISPEAAKIAPSATGGEDPSDRVRRMVAAATQALDAGDVDAYAGVLVEADGISDRLRRFQARLLCVQQGLVARSAPAPTVARTMQRSLHALVRWLEEQPSEPAFLQYAGVLCIELGAYREAEALLDTVLRLEPDWPDSAESRSTARKRRRAKVVVPSLPADVSHELKALRPRITRIAGAAVLDEGQTVGLTMIVRDEEEMLPRALAAVVDGVDEIVVVDTGSRDRTVEIAESFGAKVLHHEWTGNFSEARNVGIDAVTSDWVMVIDADEVLVADDAKYLREVIQRPWREAFFFTEFNLTGDVDDGVGVAHNALRLWRNAPDRRYSAIIHEQITHSLPAYLPDRFAMSPVRMDHYGYLGQVREDKAKDDRNFDLLRDQLAAGEDGAFLHFNIASEHLFVNEREQALEHFEIAWEKALEDPSAHMYGFMPSLTKRYIGELAHAGRFDDMEEAAEWAHKHFTKFTDVLFDQARAAETQGDTKLARERFEQCLEWGDGSSQHASIVGGGTFHAEMQLARLDVLDRDTESAIERMRRVREQNPKLLAVIDPLASTLLDSGHSPAEVVAELAGGEEGLSPSGWFSLAVNLQERGHYDEAEAAFRSAIELRPTLDHARIGLADALLVQGRIEEAVEEAARVPADGKQGAPAVRTALFGLLALDDGERLAERRAQQVALIAKTRLPDADAAVLRAWAAVRAGEPVPGGLGVAEVNALTPMLGALLRMGAADAFADLVEVLTATGIEQRTVREVLATLFLSHQQVDLAAEQWLAAVNEEGPDAESFAGLADVARLRGMPEDAVTMAREALTMDPENGLAKRVLAVMGVAGDDERTAA